MQQKPTPWQYLLDIISAARLKAAEKIINQVAREAQIARYTDLKESECTFSTPIKNKQTGPNWLVDISIPGRGFGLQGVSYKTGTVMGMAKPNANVMLNASTLDVNTTTGLYFVEETQQLHLLVHPQSNLWEALQMTGYSFTPKQFSAEEYGVRNKELKADGHIDIKDSVVAGRLYVSYVQRDIKKDPQEEVNKLAGLTATDVVIPNGDNDATIIPKELLDQGSVLPVTPENAGLPINLESVNTEKLQETKPELSEEEQIQQLLDADAEKAEEKPAEEETPAVEEPTPQKNKKK